MSKYANLDMDNAIENVIEQLNLKNQLDLANKLNITNNALSMLKKRNSIGTLIEKLLELDDVISFDSMLYGTDSKELKKQINDKINKDIEDMQKKLRDLNAKNYR